MPDTALAYVAVDQTSKGVARGVCVTLACGMACQRRLSKSIDELRSAQPDDDVSW